MASELTNVDSQAVMFAKYDVLFETLKGLYAYLDLHWEQWRHQTGGFDAQELDADYQSLIKSLADSISLMGDKPDEVKRQ